MQKLLCDVGLQRNLLDLNTGDRLYAERTMNVSFGSVWHSNMPAYNAGSQNSPSLFVSVEAGMSVFVIRASLVNLDDVAAGFKADRRGGTSVIVEEGCGNDFQELWGCFACHDRQCDNG
jgi:hypothetical protein